MKTGLVIGVVSSSFFATSVAVAAPPQSEYCQLPQPNHYQQQYRHSHTNHRNQGYHVNVNLDKFNRRIQRGINNGQLTHQEAQVLRQKLHHLSHALNRVRADGYVSKQEKHRVEHKAQQLSSLIHQKKHNSITRYSNHHNYSKGVVYHFHL